MEVAGSAAIVTGAARGIGRAVARRLAAEGAAVVVADVDEAEGAAVADEIVRAGGEAAFVPADVTAEPEVRELVAACERTYGGLAVLVNNAGGYEEPVFPDAPVEHWTRTLELNLRAVMLGIHYALPAMRRRGGAIVNVASSAGLGLGPHPSPEYAAAKAAVMRLTASLAPLADDGIRVNCICPHTVATAAVLETIADLRARDEELPPPLRIKLIPPDDLAEGVVRLVRDDTLAGRVLVYRGGEEPRLLPP
jgi:NAD(P)-dependent dehydrogenase (short-subunit alcohol dehydrogenase family)